jgi:hypothetical protein
MIVEPGRLRRVDQAHHALGQPLLREEGVIAIGDDVDNGIADAQHIEAGVGHRSTPVGKARPLGGRSSAVNRDPGCRPRQSIVGYM